jgi:hypothetical protein
MINKALDLPFDDPQETYSSSEHFLHDQGIAPGIKGRVIPEGQVVIERKPRTDGRGGGGRGQAGRGGSREGGGRSQGGRSRGPRSSEEASATEKAPSAEGGDRPPRKRNRNRRRTRGGSSSATTGDNG